MNITVNGENIKIEKSATEENATIEMLIEKLGVTNKVMAAAINLEVVKKDKWGQTSLKEGDRVELLQFVGGG